MMLLNLNHLHTSPRADPVSTIVYAAGASNVETVVIDGEVVLRERQLTTLNEREVINRASDEAARLARAGGL
jgi:5-methylthioadenosine/S-adenosylhomocysteine deaminase